MPNIRIKDIPTTASSTSSTDFIGIDGTTNGTRKLNAYSPSFGGNLTVSGTGTSSVAGSLVIGGGALSGSECMMVRRATAGYTVLNTDGTTTGGFYVGSGLWVGTSSNHPLDFFTNGSSTLMRLTTSGNLLLGTTTDSANGKLQLAAHTTSAGGIGFGTDTSLYRVRGGTLGLNDASGSTNPRIDLFEGGTFKASLQTYLGAMYVGTEVAGASLYLRTGAAVTALTLDSSQNAEFKGRAGIGGAPITSSSLILRGSSLTSGATQVGLDQQTTFSSGATTAGRGIASVLVTTAASFTMVNGAAFYAITPVLGAGSSVTTNTGLYIANQGATGITNAYGIDIAAQSGAATTNVAIRAAGKIMFTSLPTSSAGLASGELWNDSGTVKIA